MPSLAHFFGANWWILNLMIESGWGSASVEVSEWAREVSENYILPSPGNTYFILWYLHPIVLISPNPFPLALISHKKKLDKKKRKIVMNCFSCLLIQHSLTCFIAFVRSSLTRLTFYLVSFTREFALVNLISENKEKKNSTGSRF